MRSAASVHCAATVTDKHHLEEHHGEDLSRHDANGGRGATSAPRGVPFTSIIISFVAGLLLLSWLGRYNGSPPRCSA